MHMAYVKRVGTSGVCVSFYKSEHTLKLKSAKHSQNIEHASGAAIHHVGSTPTPSPEGSQNRLRSLEKKN